MNKPGTGIHSWEISAPCYAGGGGIACIITGNRQYLLDHLQGGLDIPCQLVFKGTENMLTKIKPVLQDVPNFDLPSNGETSSSSQNASS